MLRILLSFAVLLGVAGCNPMANLEEADEQVSQFEDIYSAGDVDRAWSMLGDAWKEVSTKQEFDDLHQVLSVRLGKINGSERVNFNVNSTNGVTTTVVVMDTNFEKGDGTQTYTFHGHGEDLELVGWTVNSPRLQLTADDVADEADDEVSPIEVDASGN